MASEPLKQKIVLEGEKEYSNAIKAARRDLKTLRSEMQAETAELGKNATAQQKAEVKTKSLQKQIAEQEKIVKACRDALDEVKQKYSDNEEAVAKYEQRLNSARTELANMHNALEEVDDSLENIQQDSSMGVVAAKSLADSLQEIGNAGSVVSGAIENIFTGMVDTVKGAITTVWEDMVELAGRANNWIDLAGFWNTDAATIQKWAGAVGHVSGTLEDLNSIVMRINSKDGSLDMASLVGVSHENYQDDWQYAMAVMDAMSKMDHQSRNNAAYTIFGKSPDKALDLLNDWDNVLAHLDQYDINNGGIGMTEEEMQTMSDLYDKVNGIRSMWRAFKDSFEAGLFGKVALDLAGNAEGVLQGLIDYWNADSDEEREKAIDKIEENLTGFFTRLGEAISEAAKVLDDVGSNLEESENGTVSAIGSILKKISDVLDWFADDNNIDKVVHGFEALFAVWTGAKIASAVGHLASLAANIALIKSTGGIFGLFGKGGGAGNAATTAANAANAAGTTAASAGGGMAVGGALANGIANFLTSWKGVTASAVLYGVPMYDRLKEANRKKDAESQAIMDMASEAAPSVTTNTREQNQRGLRLLLAGLVNDQGTIDEIAQEAAPAVSPIREGNGQDLSLTEQQRQAAEIFWDAFRDDSDFTDEEWDAYEGAFKGFEGLFDELETRINNFIQRTPDDSWRSYEDIPAEIFSEIGGMNGASQSLDNASNTLKGLPALMAAAVRSGVSNIVVTIDGQRAGSLLAPYVSQSVAREIM